MAQYEVHNAKRPQGAAIPLGWHIEYNASGNPVYVKDRQSEQP